MPRYISDVINQINYNANFEFTFDQLPNDVPQNDADACRQYKNMLNDHINRVQHVWYRDTGIETLPDIDYGDYYYWSHYTHESPKSLRDIAIEEYQVDKKVISDIDNIINLHDRSRYSEDEFYAAANHFFGIDNLEAFRISELKHFQRNAHEFSHYVYHTETGPTRRIELRDGSYYTSYEGILMDMPAPYVWVRVAVWLANYEALEYKYNDNWHQNPFQHYWGRDHYYKWVWVDTGEGGGYWKKVWGGDPVLPDDVQMTDATKLIVQHIVDRWAQVLPDPE